jgi:hypothetical protein
MLNPAYAGNRSTWAFVGRRYEKKSGGMKIISGNPAFDGICGCRSLKSQAPSETHPVFGQVMGKMSIGTFYTLIIRRIWTIGKNFFRKKQININLFVISVLEGLYSFQNRQKINSVVNFQTSIKFL